jgi:nucleoside-diphosphate-sugar epimerase
LSPQHTRRLYAPTPDQVPIREHHPLLPDSPYGASKAAAMASRPIPVAHDAGRFRPVDKPFVVGDNSRLRSLGWAPQVALEQSLAAILGYWRGQG